MHRLASLLLALGLGTGLVIALPLTAGAHDVLERTSPSDGTTVDRAPAEVVLTFSEAPLELGAQVVVETSAGDVAEGAPTISGREVHQPVAATAPPGDYTVRYRITSDDGHPVTGTFAFFARVGGNGVTATAGPSVRMTTATGDAAAKESQFVPVMLTIAGTTILLAVGGFVVLRGSKQG